MLRAFTMDRLTVLGTAGAGAAVAAVVQQSGAFTGLGDNTRDLVLLGAAMMMAGAGGGVLRNFAVGFGAAAVSSLVRRNILTLA